MAKREQLHDDGGGAGSPDDDSSKMVVVMMMIMVLCRRCASSCVYLESKHETRSASLLDFQRMCVLSWKAKYALHR